MPQIGTWGVVMFPYGDIRNGIWMGSYYPSQVDALTTTQASGFAPTDPFIDYAAYFSGHWHLLDGLGNQATQWADGSYLTAAAASGLPTIYRHTVVANKQQNIPYARSTRIPNPPSGFVFDFEHISGTRVGVTASGSTYASGAVGASGLYTYGGTKATIDASGNTTVSGAAGASLTFNFGAATITIASGGTISVNVPNSDTFNVTQGSMSAGDALALVSALVAAFNAHTHAVVGVQAGSSTITSNTPTSPWSASTIESAVAKVSN